MRRRRSQRASAIGVLGQHHRRIPLEPHQLCPLHRRLPGRRVELFLIQRQDIRCSRHAPLPSGSGRALNGESSANSCENFTVQGQTDWPSSQPFSVPPSPAAALSGSIVLPWSATLPIQRFLRTLNGIGTVPLPTARCGEPNQGNHSGDQRRDRTEGQHRGDRCPEQKRSQQSVKHEYDVRPSDGISNRIRLRVGCTHH